jgi:hypothetical protein
MPTKWASSDRRGPFQAGDFLSHDQIRSEFRGAKRDFFDRLEHERFAPTTSSASNPSVRRSRSKPASPHDKSLRSREERTVTNCVFLCDTLNV